LYEDMDLIDGDHLVIS